nr:ribosomal protein L28 [Cavernulicola chilensis]
MSRKCQLMAKQANNAYNVTYSHKRNKKLQDVNLQIKKVWVKNQNRYIRVKLSTKAIKSLRKNSLEMILSKFNTSL